LEAYNTGNTNIADNITSVAFRPLTKLAALCYVNGNLVAVYNFIVSCDVNTLNTTVKEAVNWCNTTAGPTSSWKVKFVNVYQYVPAGGVGVVVGPIIPYDVVQKGATFSFKIKFAQSYVPNPANLYQLALSNKLTINDIIKWLESNNNHTSAVGAFDAVCESCAFSVG
jgi:hypothetical protein